MWQGPAVFDVLTAPPLLDAVESIIGPEIYSNPTQHVRLKPPEALTPINPETEASSWERRPGTRTAGSSRRRRTTRTY